MEDTKSRHLIANVKNERAKYLIVDAKDVVKSLYRIERVFAFNDFDNLYYKEGTMTIDEAFSKTGIVPDEFRKIIIKIKRPFLGRNEIEEYITGLPFSYKTRSIEKIGNQEYILISNTPIYHDGQIFTNKFIIRTNLKYRTAAEVKDFLTTLDREGYSQWYLMTTGEFFEKEESLKEEHSKCIRLNRDEINK